MYTWDSASSSKIYSRLYNMRFLSQCAKFASRISLCLCRRGMEMKEGKESNQDLVYTRITY